MTRSSQDQCYSINATDSNSTELTQQMTTQLKSRNLSDHTPVPRRPCSLIYPFLFCIPDEWHCNDLGMTTEIALTFCLRYWLNFSLSLVSIFFFEWRRRMNWSRVHLVSSKQAWLASRCRLSLRATSKSWLQVGQQCNAASFLAFSPPPSSPSIPSNFADKLLKVGNICMCLL